MAYFRSPLTAKWPNMIPDALGGARGYSCSPRRLCAWQLPPRPLLLHTLKIGKQQESQKKRRCDWGTRGQVLLAAFRKPLSKCFKCGKKRIRTYLFLLNLSTIFRQPGGDFFILFSVFSQFLPSFYKCTLISHASYSAFCWFIFRHHVSVGGWGMHSVAQQLMNSIHTGIRKLYLPIVTCSFSLWQHVSSGATGAEAGHMESLLRQTKVMFFSKAKGWTDVCKRETILQNPGIDLFSWMCFSFTDWVCLYCL